MNTTAVVMLHSIVNDMLSGWLNRSYMSDTIHAGINDIIKNALTYATIKIATANTSAIATEAP